jgi:zinc protease
VELTRLREDLAPADESERAIRQIEAQYVYSSEVVTNQAYWLGQWDVVDSWSRAMSLPDEIRAVTADDVRRVAQLYLSPDRRTVGWLIPTEGGQSGNAARVEPDAAYRPPIAWGLSGSVANELTPGSGFERAVLANGIPVLGQDRPESASIALRVRVPAGTLREAPAESGLAHLAARATMRGSGGQTFEEISTWTDTRGSSISIDAGRQYVEARVRCLPDDFPEMVDLLAQTLLRPDFPVDEVKRVKDEQLGAISEADNDTRATADRLLRRIVYPSPNPLGRRVIGEKEVVGGFTANDAQRFHADTYLPAGTSIAVVGGIGGFDRAIDIIASRFAGWLPAPTIPASVNLGPTNQKTVQATGGIPGKSQADFALGIATIPRGSSDYYALEVANLILGRLGLMGRLGAEVRDRQGLAYYAFSQIEPRVDGSLWSARAGVDPGNVDRALEAITRELDRLRSELVSEEELRDAKSYLIGVLPLALESHDGVASTLLTIEEFDLGLDFLQRYPEIINGITRDDVLGAAKRCFDPERVAIAVARPE